MLDIAVCVCTYHRPTTLRHLLETLAEQTLRPREVIVVDNDHAGSARDVCERFDAPFTIRYAIESVQNISRARNHALSLASCPWLAFIDDD
ncbi:glycosyltransferase family A protein, partial [uncultured Abyssibacter sp.]|uniref:glycosyltransferase family 2 protein n=1 Tax=uncultured Abyssibacter sp. TaxID=2320202 RepID=UPI0032B2178F